MAAIENEHRKTQEGMWGKFDFVNTRALERLGINQMKLESGDNFIRIISPKFSRYSPENLPFYGREVFVHSNIGSDRRTYICARRTKDSNGQPFGACPVCEYADQIRAQNPDDKRLSELYASCRYLFFVYNVKDASTEAKGLHWLDAPKSVKDNIVSISRDRRTGTFIDVSDPKTGADIEFTRVGTKLSTKYEGFKLSNKGTPPDEWYQNVPDEFDEFLLWPDYNAVHAEVFGGAAPVPTTDNSQQQPAPGAAPTRQRVSEMSPVVDPVPTTEPQQVVPQLQPQSQPGPAPQPQSQPGPAPQPQSQQAVPQPQQPAPGAAPTRDRGQTSQVSAISPEVQARLDQLTKRSA